MSNEKIRIKAFWGVYGPAFHCGGKRTDCVSDTSSWVVAASDLERWIKINHTGKLPDFYGPSAEQAEKGWQEWNA